MSLKGINICRQYVGLQEVRDEEQIMSLLRSQAINNDIVVNPSQTPWCAAWMNFCERAVGNDGTGKLNALSFNEYGVPVNPPDMQIGDILTFHRGSNSYEGHVTYLEAINEDGTVTVIGGNQADSVCRETRSLDRLVAVRRS